MTLLIDMNLSPLWVGFLKTHGVEAVHLPNCNPPFQGHKLMSLRLLIPLLASVSFAACQVDAISTGELGPSSDATSSGDANLMTHDSSVTDSGGMDILVDGASGDGAIICDGGATIDGGGQKCVPAEYCNGNSVPDMTPAPPCVSPCRTNVFATERVPAMTHTQMPRASGT